MGVFRLDVLHRVARACPVRPVATRVFLPGSGGRGRTGALMAAAVRESVTVAGRAERARVARTFVAGVLGPGHPCGDDAALLVAELFSNSLWYSHSGAPGETVTVAIRVADGIVRVEVADRSGPGVPQLRHVGQDAESGRGLGLVTNLAARWGWRRRGRRTVTWFELAVPHTLLRGDRPPCG